jgi:hypothetical protein
LLCPQCKHNCKFKGYREKNFISVCGDMRLRRAYYHCPGCGEGRVPWDETLRFTKRGLTPGAEESLALAGCHESFDPAAAKLLRRLAGIRVSGSTTRRTTEDAGARLQAALEQKVVFGKRKTWPWQEDAAGRTCAYVSLDHTGIRQQGPGGVRAEGKMAAVGMIYNPTCKETGEPLTARYVAGFESLDALGLKLRREAALVGWDEADQQVAISDGGAGLEEFFRKNFPRATVILDFWHASEHLGNLAEALHPHHEAERIKLKERWAHKLKYEGGRALLDELERLDLTSVGKAARETHRVETQYLRNNLHRTDYPRYVANGWQIGSGPIEAACKHVIGARLKGSGRRWSKPGSDQVSHLRALLLSESDAWETFWRPQPI